ncbi:uncharacterized protein LOC110692346 [Chenopodium quinoa]|uniref:uncharacterized protein LOC110692346 n=1 Tax=Chenopodium quinoa TaxID=63459 RepID=UPI000B76F813|nr:uncharacterized protein LOC110692346 [Chenopodium quinoa]
MVRVKQPQKQELPNNNYDVKSHLAIDTCNIYHNSHFSCIHINNNNHSFDNSSIQSHFIDWYLILRVTEDSSFSTIKKQYHNLALLLHPDKNKHPKAEFAFKLISQAYNCLSDEAKRISFNLERLRNHCTQCSRIPHNTNPTHNSNTSSSNSSNSTKNSKFYKLQQHCRAIRDQLIHEAKVIESCIRVHQRPKNEYPVFDPSSYTHSGYPHMRNNHHHNNLFYKKGASFRDVPNRKVFPNFDQRKGRCEIPIFELRTDCSSLNINSACVSS